MTISFNRYKTKIDNMEFTFGHISPRLLRKVFLDISGKLIKTINPKIDAKDFSSLVDKNLDQIIDIGYMLKNLGDVLNETEIEAAENVLFSSCMVNYELDGVKKYGNVLDCYDEVFGDDFLRSLKLLKEAFKCYYASFFLKAEKVIDRSILRNTQEK